MSIKENQILIDGNLYNRLLDISTGGIITLKVIKEPNDAEGADTGQNEFYVTVVGVHRQPTNVVMHRAAFDYLGESPTFRYTLVKPLPPLTDISVKILENDFCMIDPRQKVQEYLEDYHILYEGMQFAVPTDIDMMHAIVRIESLKPSAICKVPNGEVNFEIVTDAPMVSALRAPEPQEEPIHSSPLIQEPLPYDFNAMRQALFPDLAAQAPAPEPYKLPQPQAEVPKTKEELRAARLAYYANKNSDQNT